MFLGNEKKMVWGYIFMRWRSRRIGWGWGIVYSDDVDDDGGVVVGVKYC